MEACYFHFGPGPDLCDLGSSTLGTCKIRDKLRKKDPLRNWIKPLLLINFLKYHLDLDVCM